MKPRRALAWALPHATASLMLGIALGRVMNSAVPGLFACALCLAACLAGKGRLRRAAAVLLACAIGCAAGYAAYHPDLPEEGTRLVCGVIADEVRLDEENGHLRTVLRSVTLDGEPYGAGVYWSCYGLREKPEWLRPGAWVRVTARIYAPSAAENPGGYDFREYELQQGVTLGAYGAEGLEQAPARFSLEGAAAGLRDRLSRGLCRVMGEQAGGYASAMLLGCRRMVPEEERAAFTRLGIVHILTVSGFHVAVLAGLAAWILDLLRVRAGARLAVLAAILGGYALLTGLHPPVVRASILALSALAGRLFHRRASGVHLLCLAACVMLLVSPVQLTSASFQLSFMAVAGILLVTPWLQGLVPVRRVWARRVWSAVCAAIGAQTGLLLPQLNWFQELPVAAGLFNVPTALLSPVLLGGYWLTLGLMWVPGLGEAMGWISAALTEGATAIVRLVGQSPWLTLWTARAGIVTALGCALVIFSASRFSSLTMRRRALTLLLGLAVTALSVVPWTQPGVSYVQLSVGDADAAVLRDEGQVWVIDTGEDAALSSYLHAQRLAVDGLILTHLHTDHARGVRSLLDAGIPIRACFLPWGAQLSRVGEEMTALLTELEERGTQVVYLARGDVLETPSGTLTVLWPERGMVRSGQDANEWSLVIRAELLGTSMLLTGDLDGRYEAYAAASADILKAAHHGSASSTLPAFLAQVSPQTVILSCGSEERETEFIRRTGRQDAVSTWRKGALTLRFHEGGYTIEGFKER